MNKLTVDGEEYEIEKPVSDLIILISRERDSLREIISQKYEVGYRGQRFEHYCEDNDGNKIVIGWSNDKDTYADMVNLTDMVNLNPNWKNHRVKALTPINEEGLIDAKEVKTKAVVEQIARDHPIVKDRVAIEKMRFSNMEISKIILENQQIKEDYIQLEKDALLKIDSLTANEFGAWMAGRGYRLPEVVEAISVQIQKEEDRNHASVEEIAWLQNRIKVLEAGLVRLRDCDWTVSLPDRMDAVREIAREALKS